MKRIFTLFFVFIALFAILGSTVSYAAEEVTEPPGTENVTEEAPEAEPTFADRLREYVDSGKLYELLGLAASLVMLAVAYYLKKLVNTGLNKLFFAVKSGNDKMSDNAQSMTDAASQSKAALEAYAGELKQKLDEFSEGMLGQFRELASRFEVQTVTHEQVRTIEEILGDIADMVDMVYEGSKTIPAAVKERVGESYNHAKGLLAEVKLPEVKPLEVKPPEAEVHTND
ncbi:MAG: hypothetical protein IJ459_02035 [Clostridia bacterium]|nr:hypothetical protein [Clostridia bacterium]